MNMFRLLVVIFCYGLFIGTAAGVRASTRPNVVNVGAIFSFNTSIGKVAKVAMEAAVEDVNSNPAVLKGTKLNMPCSILNSLAGFWESLKVHPLKHLSLISSLQFSHSFL